MSRSVAWRAYTEHKVYARDRMDNNLPSYEVEWIQNWFWNGVSMERNVEFPLWEELHGARMKK